MMIYTQGAVAQMDDTVKHWEHSHNGTVTVKKQQQQHTTWTGQYLDVQKVIVPDSHTRGVPFEHPSWQYLFQLIEILCI